MNLLLNMKHINKILAKIHFKCKYKKNVKKPIFLPKHVSMMLLEVSLSCLHFFLMVSEGEVKSPCFLQVWWALGVQWTNLLMNLFHSISLFIEDINLNLISRTWLFKPQLSKDQLILQYKFVKISITFKCQLFRRVWRN